MSNFSSESYLNGQVIISGEYMNGTGEVRLFVAGPTDEDDGTGITMSNDEAVELATALFRHAAEARAAQVSEAGWIEALERELASARAWDERQARRREAP